MKPRNHPRLVGAFALGAVALVVGAVVALGSGAWLEPRDRFVVVFPGSVKGLNSGSPVTFRGVKIGEVKRVRAVSTGRDEEPIVIGAMIEIVKGIVEAPEGEARPLMGLSGQALADEFIKRGLRARLLSLSLLTGQKYIELDILPDEPARFGGVKLLYPELPTTPTAIERLGEKGEQFMAKLAELPLDQMLDDVRQAINGLRTLLQSDDVRRALQDARRAARTFEATLTEAREAMAETRAVMHRLEGQVEQTGGAARDTLRQAREGLDRAERTLARLEQTLEGADEARVTAAHAFEDLSRSLTALRHLADYLQAHPESLLLGKEQGKERP